MAQFSTMLSLHLNGSIPILSRAVTTRRPVQLGKQNKFISLFGQSPTNTNTLVRRERNIWHDPHVNFSSNPFLQRLRSFESTSEPIDGHKLELINIPIATEETFAGINSSNDKIHSPTISGYTNQPSHLQLFNLDEDLSETTFVTTNNNSNSNNYDYMNIEENGYNGFLSSSPNSSFLSSYDIAKGDPDYYKHTHIEINGLPNRDWNKEYNEILESPLIERAEKLRKLEREFVEVASQIGKIIMNEKNLPQAKKSIKNMGSTCNGIAGGDKYQVNNIFFKFAVDHNGLYGSDESAMKVACHELKGHTALVSCGMMYGLKLGLMTVLDYQGSRLTATSVLPISDDTLIYGSSDGGKLVYASVDLMNEIMRKCGKVLNLKGHMAGIGNSKKFIYGPCDLEGHLGHDGYLYAIDLARLFPPETPERSKPGCFLYNLLRPELVRQFHKPLSSDAFTLFGQHDSDSHDAEVREATDFMRHTLIPQFASQLSHNTTSSTDGTQLDIEDILVRLHRNGINIRFLGQVRSHVTCPAHRKLLLTEICSRVLKNELRRKLRESKSTDEMTYRILCADYFNNAFIRDSRVAQVFWELLKRPIQARFIGALSDVEAKIGFDLRKHLHLEFLYYRLQFQLGININIHFNDFPVRANNISPFIVKTKQMYTVPRIEADAAAELARNSNCVDDTRRYLDLAREKYNSVLELKPDDHIVLSNLGMVLAESAALENDALIKSRLYDMASEKFQASIDLKSDDPHSLIMWGDALVNQVLHDSHNANSSLLTKAVELSLKAESLSRGVGAVIIARASALQGHENVAKKWLTHASAASTLPEAAALHSDPALASVRDSDWFHALVSA